MSDIFLLNEKKQSMHSRSIFSLKTTRAKILGFFVHPHPHTHRHTHTLPPGRQTVSRRDKTGFICWNATEKEE